MRHTPESILQQYWKHAAFRPMQAAIIESVLAGEDTLALLPTGGGKSLCFQIPALLKEGICLVISPLVALMQDQVAALRDKDIPAAALHSGLTYFEVKTILQHAAYGDYKFLYLSPERLESTLFREYLPALPIELIAVDEAHCISQWGYDFRPPYLRIANLRNELPGVPVIALTASATPLVQDDIVQQLKFGVHQIFRSSFERVHLSYSSFKVDSKLNKLFDILQNVTGSSIVYCSSRKQTKQLAHALILQKINAAYYHAGLPQEERTLKQKEWIEGNTRVMVCTNAFGMGIDKASVRSVIHYDVPECLENYYQEAGRAGRDGKRAYGVLLYQQEDLDALKALPDRRFPAIPLLKQVYQSLADYLQIPVGVGEGNYYDFDLIDFVKSFQLDGLLVVHTLKVLQQEGHLSFEENIFLPTQVCFTASKETLETVAHSYPELQPIIQSLLRSYEGIIDNRVSVYEKQLAKLNRCSVEEISLQLQQLAAYDLIEYLPRKETPQIHFLLNRAPAQYLHIDQDRYLQRKANYAARVEELVNYVNTSLCRSRFIANYFGDHNLQDCGICDVCLAGRQKEITPTVFARLAAKLLALTKKGNQSTASILEKTSDFPKAHVWIVLEQLQDTKLIQIDEQGMVTHLPPASPPQT